MIYISNHNENWIERTKEDLPIHDNNGRAVIMNRLWQKLNNLDDLKKVFDDELGFQEKIEKYVYAGKQYRDLHDFLKLFTDEILVFGE